MSQARSPEQPWLPRPDPEQQFAPGGASLAPWLQERLFAQRIVALRRSIDTDAATEAVAILLSLDAAGPEPVHLHLNARDGDLDAVFAIIDAVDIMRAPAHALVTAEVGGAAVGLLAAARKRTAYPHARVRLAEPALVGRAGTAEEMAAVAGRHLQALEELAKRIAEASGQSLSRVESDLDRRLTLSAAEAKEYGLIDEISAG